MRQRWYVNSRDSYSLDLISLSALLSPSNRPSPSPRPSLSAVLDTCIALPGSPIYHEKVTFLERGSLGTSLGTSALKTHWMHHQSICRLSFSRYSTHKGLLIINYASDFPFISSRQGMLKIEANWPRITFELWESYQRTRESCGNIH